MSQNNQICKSSIYLCIYVYMSKYI
uniref:Uncharacterized protein n=1 Tax=Arundo donax TaxID=35708 RepID=A0A0A9HL55_ARUDO